MTRRIAATSVAAGLVVLAGLAFRLQRGFSFVVDEWDVLAHYTDGNYLAPYNGHLSLLPVAIYQGLASTVGIDSYRAYGTLGIAIFLAIPVAFFLTHRRLVDHRLVAVAALGIAWSWAAQGNLLYGFLMNFNLPLLMLVIAWPLLRRNELRADVWVVLVLAVALASSSVGVVVAVAIGAELLVGRAPLRRLVRFVPPVAAWIVWWIFGHEATKPATLAERADYAWHVLVGILAGFTLGWAPGAAISAAGIAVIISLAWKRWRTVDAHVIAILCTLGFFIVLSAYSRAGDIALNPPNAARYVWLGDLLIVAALIWCVRGRRLPAVAPLLAAVVVIVGAIGLVGHLRDFRHFVLDYGAGSKPYLAEAEAAGTRADPSRNLPLNLIPVTVGQYLQLVDRVGSPIADVPYEQLGNRDARRAADLLLIEDEQIALQPVSRRPGCSGTWSRAALRPEVTVDPGTTVVITNRSSPAVRVQVRRFSTDFSTEPVGQVQPGESAQLRFPSDGSDLPWSIRFSPKAEVTTCPTGRHGVRN